MGFCDFKTWDIEIRVNGVWQYKHTCLGKTLQGVIDKVNDGTQCPKDVDPSDVRVKLSDAQIKPMRGY